MREILAKDIMNARVVALNVSQSVKDAAIQMKKFNIGSVFVMEGNEIIGIVTKGDIVRRVVAEGRDPSKTRLKEVMSSPVIYVDEEEPLSKVIRIMKEKRIKRVLVKSKGMAVGVIAEADLLKVIPDIIDIFQEYLRILG